MVNELWHKAWRRRGSLGRAWAQRGLATMLAISAVVSGSVHSPASSADLKVGDKLPQATLRDLNGKTINLAGFKNQAVWIALFHST